MFREKTFSRKVFLLLISFARTFFPNDPYMHVPFNNSRRRFHAIFNNWATFFPIPIITELHYLWTRTKFFTKLCPADIEIWIASSDLNWTCSTMKNRHIKVSIPVRRVEKMRAPAHVYDKIMMKNDWLQFFPPPTPACPSSYICWLHFFLSI